MYFPYVVPISTVFSGHLFPPRSVASISQGVCRLRLSKLLLQPWSTRKMPIQKWSQFMGSVGWWLSSKWISVEVGWYILIYEQLMKLMQGALECHLQCVPGNFVNCHHRLYPQHPDHADSTNILLWRHKAICPIFPKSYAAYLTFPNLSIIQAAPSIFFTKSFNIWASFHLAHGLVSDPTHLLEAPYYPKISSWRYTSRKTYTQPYYSIPKNMKKI